MTEHTLIDGINLALNRAMADDPRVLILGEDVGTDGGVFRATDGLLQTYGPDRVFDTPLAEAGIAGVAIGLAAQGFRPVVEIQFMGFIYPALDQLVNHASRLRNRTRGRLTCPMVLRAPYGGGIHAPEHHSESTEALLAHIPGLRVVIPGSPQQGYGLLLAAIADPDPVVFLEPKRLYRNIKQPVEDDGQVHPLDRCRQVRTGNDITLVSWGAMLLETDAAADALAQEGVNADVIDVATIKPIDTQTIIDSVARTGRLIIVHEAPLSGGLGAEIAACIAQDALFHLRAPIHRVASYDITVPGAPLEHHYMPDTARIVEAGRATMAYT